MATNLETNSRYYDDGTPTTEEAAIGMSLRKQYTYFANKKKTGETEEAPLFDLSSLEEDGPTPYRDDIREFSDYEVLSHVLEKRGWEEREGQIVMTEEIGSGIDTLVSAPVGIGKTLGYLIPMLKNRTQAMVATSTKALQDQIAYDELPRLADDLDELYGFRPRYTILKGKSNYLDVKRFEGLLRLSKEERRIIGLEEESEALIREEIARLEEAVARGEGSGYDSEALSAKIGNGLWRHISAISSRSPFYEETLKKAYGESEIIVTNASYVISVAVNVGLDGYPLIGFPQAIVFDEAHHITNIVTESLTSRLDIGSALKKSKNVGNIVGNIGTKTKTEFGTLIDALDEGLEIIEKVREDTEGRRIVSQVAGQILEKVYNTVNAAIDESYDSSGILVVLEEGVTDKAFLGTYNHYCKASSFQSLDTLLTFVEELQAQKVQNAALASRGADGEEPIYDYFFVLEEGEIKDDKYPIPSFSPIYINGFGPKVKAGLTDYGIYEIVRDKAEDDNNFDPSTLVVPKVPESGDAILANRQIVFTSGTISDGVQGPLGLGHSDYVKVDSPFDPLRARLFVPDMKNTPNDFAWTSEALDLTKRLVEKAGGRSMILTNSLKNMRAFAEYFRLHWSKSPIYVQGDAGKNDLISAFRENETSVLIGTKSFWEGVDVPGPALSLVVMDKIPFPYPSSSIKAREEFSRQQGKNDYAVFLDVSVLDASQMFAQGGGRLIRSTEDIGGLAILDSRISSKGYGRNVLSLLTPGTQMTNDIQAFEEWLSVVNPDDPTTLEDYDPDLGTWRSAVPKPRRKRRFQ